MDGKSLAIKLSQTWKELLARQDIDNEVDYRIRKMINRLPPIFDRIFLKTLKGREMVLDCINMTVLLVNKLDAHDDSIYYQLTELEKKYEELLSKTYEFRVKAG